MKDPIGIAIAAPREKVFQLLVEPAQQLRWIDGLVESKYDGELNKRSRGTRFRHGIREGGRIVVYDGEIRQFTPPIHFGYQMHHPYFAIEVDYLLTDVEGRTRVDYRCIYHPKTLLARVISTLFAWMPLRLAHRHLARLKELAETP